MQVLEEKHAFYAINLYRCHLFTVLVTYAICSINRGNTSKTNVSEMNLLIL